METTAVGTKVIHSVDRRPLDPPSGVPKESEVTDVSDVKATGQPAPTPKAKLSGTSLATRTKLTVLALALTLTGGLFSAAPASAQCMCDQPSWGNVHVERHHPGRNGWVDRWENRTWTGENGGRVVTRPFGQDTETHSSGPMGSTETRTHQGILGGNGVTRVFIPGVGYAERTWQTVLGHGCFQDRVNGYVVNGGCQ